jgi:hypothetical protein
MGNTGDGGAAEKELAALRQKESELTFVIRSQEVTTRRSNRSS